MDCSIRLLYLLLPTPTVEQEQCTWSSSSIFSLSLLSPFPFDPVFLFLPFPSFCSSYHYFPYPSFHFICSLSLSTCPFSSPFTVHSCIVPSSLTLYHCPLAALFSSDGFLIKRFFFLLLLLLLLLLPFVYTPCLSPHFFLIALLLTSDSLVEYCTY